MPYNKVTTAHNLPNIDQFGSIAHSPTLGLEKATRRTVVPVPDDGELEAVVAAALNDGRVAALHVVDVHAARDVLLVGECLLHLLGQLTVADFLWRPGARTVTDAGRVNRQIDELTDTNVKPPPLHTAQQGWKTDRFLVPFRRGALFSVASYPRPGLSP